MNMFEHHNIDPLKKDREWILKSVKHFWDEYNQSHSFMFYRAREAYANIKDYVLGRQSIEKYKPSQGVDPGAKTSFQAIDWTPRPIAAKLRDIGISKILTRGYNVLCTPIDAIAKTEADNYFADIRIKIMLRDMAREQGLDLDQFPALKKQPGEPEDMEEMEIMMEYGYKYNLAMESEMGVQLVMYQNGFEGERKYNAENSFDYGVGGYKEDVDANGDIYLRAIDPEKIIISYCEKGDFSDKRFVGEIMRVPLSQIASKFTDAELEEISSFAAGRASQVQNTTRWGTGGTNEMEVDVIDIEFKSWNTRSYRYSVNKAGSLVIRREGHSVKDGNDGVINYNGDELPRFVNRKQEVIYKAKWIVDTDYIYDYGLATNMKRSRPNRAKTDYSYHLDAYNFYKMTALSMMDRLIPFIDDYHKTTYKIENFKTRWIPYIIDIDFDAIENIPLGQGGKNLTKKEVLDLVFQKFVLPNRRKDLSGQNINYKSVDIRTTGMYQEFTVLASELVRILNEMRDILGLNEVTDGSSPNPRLLNYVASLGAESTNNALRPLMDSDKRLTESLSQGIIRRLVQVVKKRKVEGLLPALGSNSMKFFSLTPEISMHDWGIQLEYLPTQLEKEALMERLKIADANGQIDPEDYVIISNATNLKQAGAILAHRINKRRKEAQQEALAQIQANGKVQADSNLQAEEQKRITNKADSDNKINEIREKGKIDREIAAMKIKSAETMKEADVALNIAESMGATDDGGGAGDGNNGQALGDNL